MAFRPCEPAYTTDCQLVLDQSSEPSRTVFSDRTGRLSDCHRRIDMFLEARVVIFYKYICTRPSDGRISSTSVFDSLAKAPIESTT